jgi:hypothetical protein
MKINIDGKKYEFTVFYNEQGKFWSVWVKLPIGARTCATGKTKSEAINEAMWKIYKTPSRYIDCIIP